MGCAVSSSASGRIDSVQGKPEAPRTPEGKAAMLAADEAFAELLQNLGNDSSRDAALALLTEEAELVSGAANFLSVDFSKGTSYLCLIAASQGPWREFSGGFIDSIHYPDDGQWIVEQDAKTGSVTIKSRREILGAALTVAMMPLATELDSRGFTDQARADLADQYANLPKTVSVRGGNKSGKEEITWWNPEPSVTDVTVGGLQFFRWEIESRRREVTRDEHENILAETYAKQLEIRGMRNEPAEKGDPYNGRRYYGFELSITTSNANIQTALALLFHRILDTIEFKPREECERILGRHWDTIT
jgi:hypothetical protein